MSKLEFLVRGLIGVAFLGMVGVCLILYYC